MSSPQQFRSCVCILSEAETMRVTRFIAAAGTLIAARRLLGVSSHVFDAARAFGRMQKTTRQRILATLDREEAHA